MCGIIGIYQHEQRVRYNELIRMRDALRHRGPDDEGIFLSQSGKVALGFRRLSIIDLSVAGNQPIANEDRTKWIVFNGEVYNFKELRKKLEKRGHHFRSTGDSEVVLHAFEEFGEKCLQCFQGMFGFAIWDETSQQFFLARDRFGIKPLYYYKNSNVFLFSSEVKALLEHSEVRREIDHDAFEDYLTYGYVPYDKAIFKNMKKLPAGHCAIFKNNSVIVNKYWELEYSPKNCGEGEIVDSLNEKIHEAVKLWTVSDVPVGLFLSGGMDSSTVCSKINNNKINKLKTYSIGFDYERRSELPYARKIAEVFCTDHYEKIVTVKDAGKVLSILAQVYDEPFFDTSSVPTYYVSKFASETVKVVLTGDGGDELFFGYHWYERFIELKNNKWNTSCLREALTSAFINVVRGVPGCARLAALKKYSTSDPIQRYFRLIGFFDDWEKSRLINGNTSAHNKESLWLFRKFYKADLPIIAALRILDVNTYMVDDILTKVDRASMANSLEARTPFLDHKLAEFIMTIPIDMIYKNNQKKYILNRTMQGILPDEILTRKKSGFSAPIKSWLRAELANYVQRHLIDGYAIRDGLLKRKAISSMINNFTENRWAKLWLLLMFEEWYRRWIYNISEIEINSGISPDHHI